MKNSEFYPLLAAGDVQTILEESDQGTKLTSEQNDALQKYSRSLAAEKLQKRQYEIASKPGWAESQLTPALVQVLSSIRDTFKEQKQTDQVVIFAKKTEKADNDQANETASEDEGAAAGNVPKAGKKDKKSVRNEFYTKVSRPVGSMNRKEDITTIAVRIYSLVKKKGEEDTLEWEQHQKEYKLEISEEAVEKQQESYTKEKKKKEKKKKKPKSKMNIWDKIMVGLALLVFAPEAEAIFHKLDDMGKSLAEKIKEHFRMPEDVKKELDDIDKESDESNDSQTQKEIKDLESSSAQEFYDIAYSTLLKFAKQEKLQNPEAIARLGAAQTSLETGYGKHVVGKNYFGIKAKSGMPSVEAETTEYSKDRGTYKTKQKFRSYENYEDSFRDYIHFLKENPRYKPVLEASTPEKAIELQGKTNYATSTDYGAAISKIHERGSSGKLPSNSTSQRKQKESTVATQTASNSDISKNSNVPSEITPKTSALEQPVNTNGQKIESESRPIVLHENKSNTVVFVKKIIERHFSVNTQKQTVLSDNLYDPKPQIVTR